MRHPDRDGHLLRRPDLARACGYFEEACGLAKKWDAILDAGLQRYGDHGMENRRCGRLHFPDSVREELMVIHATLVDLVRRGYAARPKYVRERTMDALSGAVARRCGYPIRTGGPYPNDR